MFAFPSFRQMQYLRALFDTKNFRGAAEICHVTQPTLSAAIFEMEQILGGALLDRSRRKKVVFTPLGLQTIDFIDKIFPVAERFLDKAKAMSAPLTGALRLGVIPTIAPYLLPDILPPLQKTYPNMEFHIVEDMSAALVEKLENGAIDIAILAFPYDTNSLNYNIFFEEPFYVAALKGDIEKKKKGAQKIAISDLLRYKLLLLEDGHCLRDHALSACHLQNVSDKKTLSATSLHTLVQMVAQGYGITLLPEMMLNQGVIPHNVSLYPFEDPVPTRKIGVAWRPKDPQLSDIEAVIESMKTALLPRLAAPENNVEGV